MSMNICEESELLITRGNRGDILPKPSNCLTLTSGQHYEHMATESLLILSLL